MAKPIKETPELTGEDAAQLAVRIDNPCEVTVQEVAKARDAYNAVISIAKFQFWQMTLLFDLMPFRDASRKLDDNKEK